MNTYKKISLTLLLSLPLFSETKGRDYNKASEDYDVDSINFDIDDQSREFGRTHYGTSSSSATKPTTLEQTVQAEQASSAKKPGLLETTAQKTERLKKERAQQQEAARKQEHEQKQQEEVSRAAAAALRKNQAFQELQDAKAKLTQVQDDHDTVALNQRNDLVWVGIHKNMTTGEHRIALGLGIVGAALTVLIPVYNAAGHTLNGAFEWANNHPVAYLPLALGSVGAYIYEKCSRASEVKAQHCSEEATSKKSELETLSNKVKAAQEAVENCQVAYDTLNS